MNWFSVRIFVFLLFPGFLFSVSSYASAGWEFLEEEDGIKVYKKDLPGSILGAFKGETVIGASMGTIFSILSDPKLRVSWVDRLVEIKVLSKSQNPLQVVEYSRIDLPWPVSDRDFVTQTVAKYNKKTKTIMTQGKSVRHSLAPRKDDAVRGETYGAHVTLRELGPKRTFVSIDVHADPKGWMPAWLINFAQREWPYNTLTKLKELSRRDHISITDSYKTLVEGT